MLKEETKMNEKIKRAIRQRARNARSNDDLVRAVFDTFQAAEIKLGDVSLEDMKKALVEAVRGSRTDESHVGPMLV